MKNFISATILVFTLILAGAGQCVSAAPAKLSINQTYALPTYSWYAGNGLGSSSGGIFTLKGVNAKAHATISSLVEAGGTYKIIGNGMANAINKGFVGVSVFDKDWKLISENKVPLSTTFSDFSFDLSLPANAVNVSLSLVGSVSTPILLSLKNIQIQRVADDKKLRFAPPTLVNPVTIELGTGTTQTILDNSTDYIIKFPKTKKIGSTYIIGGHNIVMIGGWVTVPATKDLSNSVPARAIYIKNNQGTVHIEGILIDGSGGAQSDGIDIAAPNSIVQIQNVRVDGIFGFYDQFHADVIQTFGGVKELRVDKLTGYSGYQGLQIDINKGKTGSAKLSRINLESTGTQIWSDPKSVINHNNGGTLIWLTPMSDCNKNYPVSFEDVYVQPRAGRALSRSVWPGANNLQCPSTVNLDGSVSFPKLPVRGVVKNGRPLKGDFVPAGVVGVDYKSPGYLQ